MQDQQVGDRAVDLGAALDLAGGDVDEARGQAHLRGRPLIRASDDQGGAEQRADADRLHHAEVVLLGLQVLLGDHLVDVAALDQLRRPGPCRPRGP